VKVDAKTRHKKLGIKTLRMEPLNMYNKLKTMEDAL
jgi:ribosomal protein S1